MRIATLLVTAFTLTAAHAQDKKDPKPDSAKPPEFSGRLVGGSVELRARVTGFVTKISAREGGQVKAGDLVAEIDPRPYQVQLDLAQSQVSIAEAQLKLAEATCARDKALADKGVLSPQQLDQNKAEIDVAKAKLLAAKATRALAELNLSYTKITAPVDGRLNRFLRTEGNLLRADTDTIITLTKIEPLYVDFDVDERSYLKFAKDWKDKNPSVAIGFADEDGFPHPATVIYTSPKFDSENGKMQFRAKLANPKGDFLPGMSVRVRFAPAK